MPLDRTRKPLADRHAGDIDFLANLEQVDLERGTGLELRRLGGIERKLTQHVSGFHARLRVVTCEWLRETRGLLLAVRDLDRAVPVGVDRLDLRDAIPGNVQDGHRHGLTVIGEDACHAYLAPQ